MEGKWNGSRGEYLRNERFTFMERKICADREESCVTRSYRFLWFRYKLRMFPRWTVHRCVHFSGTAVHFKSNRALQVTPSCAVCIMEPVV